MNYITSCPACETQFLLTKEHLKAYKGKVQCGNCEHIFNAKNRLTEVSDDIQSAAEYQSSISEQASVFAATQSADEKPIDAMLSNILEGVPNLQDLTSADEESNSNQPDSSESAQAAYFNQSKSEAATKTVNISDDVTDGVSENSPAYATEQIDTPIEIEDLTTDIRFSKPKLKTNYWLLALSLLLALLAGLQSIYAMRTQIAAEYPQFKPLLQQACATLQCNIALPNNLDLLTIDDSDMQEDEDRENVIKFTSLLINNANYAQAYPNIELTLTATDDQPVLRKVIKPSEYLKANSDQAAGLGAREEVRVNLAINVKDLAVAGYRVLLVY